MGKQPAGRQCVGVVYGKVQESFASGLTKQCFQDSTGDTEMTCVGYHYGAGGNIETTRVSTESNTHSRHGRRLEERSGHGF